MKISLLWLEEWVGAPLEPEALAGMLTMAGLEVDRSSPVSASVSNIVVGCVQSVEPHPNVDRLKVCKVDAGRKALLQVVCGAPNVREGLYAPLAPAGAQIGELEIGETEIRGVSSSGMLCSASELGLDEHSSGLLELDDGVAAGTDLVEYLHLGDTVFDLDLTPDRADCFSVLGVAREVAAMRGHRLEMPCQAPVAPVHRRRFPVQVAEPSACPRYLARDVRNLRADARTPLWIRERLRRGGIRALHPVVDVMNYVMLEIGQPMHAFDLDKIEGSVEVRYARNGESIELIGGVQTGIDERTLLIADARGPLALAGIIGGAGSAVSEATRNILVECAFFTPAAVRGRARRYGLNTESSLRFERGVDRMLQQRAMERVCELLERIAGGEFGPVTEVAAPEEPAPTIELRYDVLVCRLGAEIDRNEVSKMLTRLGCRMKSCKGGWRCTPPSHRFDLEIEEDLIGEVGRLYGYDKISGAGNVAGMQTRVPLESRYDRSDKWRDRLVDRGYFEVVTHSFVEPDLSAMMSETPVLALSNAVSPAMSVMRTSIWPGLLKTLTHNLNRQCRRVRIFESGRCFNRQTESSVIAGLAYGDARPEQWGESPRAYDFYDLKGDVQSLLSENAAALSYQRSTHCGLHPGCAADILLKGERIGCLGALSPAAARRLGVTRDVFLFEIMLDAPALPVPVQIRPVPRYPSVRRDISVTVPADVNAGQVLACIRELGMELLHEIVLFDVYQDDKIEQGRKSMALGLIFQDVSSTLSDQVCAGLVENVVSALAQSLKVNLRT